MDIDEAKYMRLKRRAEEVKADADRAAGALEQQMKKLKDEFGCDTLEAAENLLAKEQAELDVFEKEYFAKLAEFESQWGSLL